jgi:solute carrier family 25 2-oxodicarboxylate transporter 21
MADLRTSFIAGGVAAAVELSVMQPLDLVKTRLQLQGRSRLFNADRFTGTFNALLLIYRAEGAAGLWRGFGSGLAIVIPRRGLKFAANDGFRSLLASRGSTQELPFRLSMLAGGLTGACEAVVITPLEVVKVAMQSERTPRGRVPTGMFAVARAAVTSGSAFNGLQATVCKHCAHSCVFFGTFAELRARAPPRTGLLDSLGVSLGAGFVAGVAAALVNNPFDVVKSRQQVAAAASIPGHAIGAAYKTAVIPFSPAHGSGGVLSSLAWILQTEGLRGWYRGVTAKVLRLGPGSAIICAAHDCVTRVLVDS